MAMLHTFPTSSLGLPLLSLTLPFPEPCHLHSTSRSLQQVAPNEGPNAEIRGETDGYLMVIHWDLLGFNGDLLG